MDYKNLEVALATVFSISIRKVGLDSFKRTSFFGSNERKLSNETKKAA